MTDGRQKLVEAALIGLYDRSNYASDQFSKVDLPVGAETKEIPYAGNFTVTRDGATGASAQSMAPSVLSLTADKNPCIFGSVPQLSKLQTLGGNWVDQLARGLTNDLKNDMDAEILQDYIAGSLAWSTAGTFISNANGDALTIADITGCKAAILNAGGDAQNLALFVSPNGEAALNNIADFVKQYDSSVDNGVVGISKIGRVMGINVYQTRSILGSMAAHTVATTAAVTTGSGVTHTYTVASGHKIQAGMMVTVSGHDADENIAAATAVTSVTATTVVVTTAATADGTSSDATGLISCAFSFNVMADKSKMYFASQIMPDVSIVEQALSTTDVIKCQSVYGRVGAAGLARILMSA